MTWWRTRAAGGGSRSRRATLGRRRISRRWRAPPSSSTGSPERINARETTDACRDGDGDRGDVGLRVQHDPNVGRAGERRRLADQSAAPAAGGAGGGPRRGGGGGRAAGADGVHLRGR